MTFKCERIIPTRTAALATIILLWSIFSASLLIKQELSTERIQLDRLIVNLENNHGQRRRRSAQNQGAKRRQRKKATDGKDDEHTPSEKRPLPFVFPEVKATSADDFPIYIVQSSQDSLVGDESSLQWRTTNWRDMFSKWDRNTKFSDIFELATPLPSQKYDARSRDSNQSEIHDVTQPISSKLVFHCLPKMASTTLRTSCKSNLMHNCPSVYENLPRRADPFGYRNQEEYSRVIEECENIHHYCVQGGDGLMNSVYQGRSSLGDKKGKATTINDSKEKPMQFIHLVPFRNFDEWALSALKTVFSREDTCDTIDKVVDQCYGYRELYFELYSKPALALLLSFVAGAGDMGVEVNDNDDSDHRNARENIGGENDDIEKVVNNHHEFSLNSMHHHRIILYDYKNTETISAHLSRLFNLPPLANTEKQRNQSKTQENCPEQIIEKFHKCYDDSLKKVEPYWDLTEENSRRMKEARKMKHMLPKRKTPRTNKGFRSTNNQKEYEIRIPNFHSKPALH